MKRPILPLLVLVAGLMMISSALAQAVSPTFFKGVSPLTLQLVIVFLSTFFAHWFTAWTKGKLGTEGRVTQLIAGFFSALIAGVGGYETGAYGQGWGAVIIALISSLVTWLASDSMFKAKVNAVQAAMVGLIQAGAFNQTPPPSVPLPQEPISGTSDDVLLIPPAAGLPGPSQAQGDTMNLLNLLTAALALGITPPTADQTAALGAWLDKHLPDLTKDIKAAGAGLNMATVLILVQDLVPAANELATVFRGLDRATVVAVVGRYLLKEYAPASAQTWLAPVLASGAFEHFIKSAYLQIFPETPVTDASELPSGAAVTK